MYDGQKHIKIIDFGIAYQFKSDGEKEKIKGNSGTPYFQAPETINDDAVYDEKCDIWSIGVILYFLLTGKFPFTTSINDLRDLQQKVRKGVYD